MMFSKKKKTFVTIFPNCENIHLIKDVGMIPYLLYKNHHYDSYIAGYSDGPFPYLESDVRGLKTLKIKKIFSGNETLNILFFLLLHLRKIDVINFYHFSLQKVLLCFIFKVLTFGRGKSYIKLDANDSILDLEYTGLKRKLIGYLVKYVDIISAEIESIVNALNKKNIFGKEVFLISNGFYSQKISNVSYDKKKKRCITVSRLDDPGKSNLTLIEGFLTFCKQNPDNEWDFVLVGAYSEKFLSAIRNITDKYAGFADRIILAGAVYDRMELAKLYEESALFLFASLSESFGFVYLEALSNKCFIISTPLNPCKEITDNWKYAAVFNYQNPDDLAVKIKETIAKDDLEKLSREGAEHVYSKYYWPIIINKLNNKLLKL